MRLTLGLLASLVSADQSLTIKSWADNLDIKYKVLTNIESNEYFNFTLTLENKGTENIHGDFPWCIYFTQDQAIKNPTTLQNIRRDSGADIGQGLSAYHVQGYLWKLCKNTLDDQSGWTNLGNGQSRTWALNGEGYIAQDSTIYPRWFFACENRCEDVSDDQNCCTPAIIKSTDSDKMTYNKPDFVAPFDTEETYLRSKDDKFSPKTPADIYDEAKNRKPGKERRSLPILPLPGFVDARPSTIQLQNGEEKPENGIPIHKRVWEITWNSRDEKCLNNGTDFVEAIRKAQEEPDKTPDVPSAWTINNGYMNQPGWMLGVSSSMVLQTNNCDATKEALNIILKLIEKLKSDEKAMLFNGDYYGSDKPRMETRGMMLDISRNYYGLESIMTLLGIMAELSMNQLHLRLTDDEGWRIAIEGLPELTEIGAKRCFDPTGTKCIMPQHGSGPETGDGAGSGYLTEKDYTDILEEGKRLGIRIVPEIVAPSHSAAAITAMRNRDDYKLVDPGQNDDSQSVQGFYDNTLNPCMDDTEKFLKTVVGALAKMHQNYMDIHNHFHIGGDEVNAEYFKTSPICQDLVANDPDLEDFEDLQLYFFKKYMKIVTDAADFNIDAWEEVWEFERPDAPGLFEIYDPAIWTDSIREKTNLTAYHWNNMWQEYDTSSTGYMMANKGYKVVLAPATHTYLDMAIDADPNSRGLMWATRYSDLWKTFSFRPMHMNNNGLWSINGEKIDSGCIDGQDGKDFKCTKLEKPENIVGLQGCMWSEENIKEEFMWNQIFPRLAAVADRAYREADWESIYQTSSWNAVQSKNFTDDFGNFRYSLSHFHRYLENLDLPYNLPKPGARSKSAIDNIYIWNKQYYRKKGDNKWLNRKTFLDNGVDDDDIVEIATASLNENRFSYPIEIKWGEKNEGGGGNGGGGGSGHSVTILISSLLLAIMLL